MTIEKVIEIFHYSNENEIDEKSKKAKNEERFLNICREIPEVSQELYKANPNPDRNIMERSIYKVNEKYASMISLEDLENAIIELRNFLNFISDTTMDAISMTEFVLSYEFTQYQRILDFCKITPVKSISRLNNMKKIFSRFLRQEIKWNVCSKDLPEQINFFGNLLSHYENIHTDNCYVLFLRYDLKARKRKK